MNSFEDYIRHDRNVHFLHGLLVMKSFLFKYNQIFIFSFVVFVFLKKDSTSADHFDVINPSTTPPALKTTL